MTACFLSHSSPSLSGKLQNTPNPHPPHPQHCYCNHLACCEGFLTGLLPTLPLLSILNQKPNESCHSLNQLMPLLCSKASMPSHLILRKAKSDWNKVSYSKCKSPWVSLAAPRAEQGGDHYKSPLAPRAWNLKDQKSSLYIFRIGDGLPSVKVSPQNLCPPITDLLASALEALAVASLASSQLGQGKVKTPWEKASLSTSFIFIPVHKSPESEAQGNLVASVNSCLSFSSLRRRNHVPLCG